MFYLEVKLNFFYVLQDISAILLGFVTWTLFVFSLEVFLCLQDIAEGLTDATWVSYRDSEHLGNNLMFHKTALCMTFKLVAVQYWFYNFVINVTGL